MKKRSVSIIFLTVVIDLIGFGLILPLIPIYTESFHAKGWQIGVILSAYSAMQFVFAPIWGRISDRIGRRPIMLVGLGGSDVFYALLGYACALPANAEFAGLAVCHAYEHNERGFAFEAHGRAGGSVPGAQIVMLSGDDRLRPRCPVWACAES